MGGAALRKRGGERAVGIVPGHPFFQLFHGLGICRDGFGGLFTGFDFSFVFSIVDVEKDRCSFFVLHEGQQGDRTFGVPGAQERGIRVLQEGQEYPLVEAAAAQDFHWRDGVAAVELRARRTDGSGKRIFVTVLHRSVVRRQHQFLSGSRHGDVEDAERFGALTAQTRFPDGAVTEGGVGEAGVRLPPLETDAEFRMQDELPVQLRIIEFVVEVRDDADPEFKSLGLVDTHDLHHVRVGGQRGCRVERTVLLSEAVHVADEPGQTIGAVGVVAVGVLKEQLQVRDPLFSEGHGADDGVVRSLLVDAAQELSGAHGDGQSAEPAQRGQEIGTVCIATFLCGEDGFVEVRVTAPDAQGGHFVFGEAEERGEQHGQQRHVLDGVVDDGKERQHGHDFRGLEEPAALFGVDGDARLAQRFAVDVGGVFHTAQKDREIFVGKRFLSPLAVADGVGDVPRDMRSLRLFLLRARAGSRRDDVEFDVRFFPVFVSVFRSEVQLLRSVVSDLADRFAHEAGERVVDRVQDALAAAEIAAEDDGGRVGVGFRVVQRICLFFGEEQFRHGLAEPVDALLDVAHHEEVVFGEGGEDGVLEFVRVLILVDEHFLELFPQGLREFGAGEGLGGRIFDQKLQRKELRVGEVQRVFFPFQFRVFLIEPEDRVHQFLREGSQERVVDRDIVLFAEGELLERFGQLAFCEVFLDRSGIIDCRRRIVFPFVLRVLRLFEIGNV